MRNTKCLVQIQVTNIHSHITWTAKADLRVHIRAVHVNLAAVRVHDLANFTDGGFEHAMGRRIGHH